MGGLTAIKENGGTALATFTYDNLGRCTALTRANGSVTGYAFDGASRLIDLAEGNGSDAAKACNRTLSREHPSREAKVLCIVTLLAHFDRL